MSSSGAMHSLAPVEQRFGLQESPEPSPALSPTLGIPSWEQHWSILRVSAGCIHPWHCQPTKAEPVPCTPIPIS